MSRSLKLAVPCLSLIALVALWLPDLRQTALAQEATAESEPAATIATPEELRERDRGRKESQHTWDLSAPLTPAEQKIERALDDPEGVDIDFSFGQPLKEAFDFLGDAHEITILIDEKALQDIGIQPDEQLNPVLSKITLRSALSIMLEPLGLTYVCDDEVLKITTREEADALLETRVYDVRSLEKADLESLQVAHAIIQTIDSDTWPVSALFPTGTASGSAPARRPGQEPERRRRNDTGIVALPGAIIVTHNQEVHRRIVALLEQLARFAERVDKD